MNEYSQITFDFFTPPSATVKKPVNGEKQAEAPRPSIAAPTGTQPAAKGTAYVQVGALSSKAGAEARWAELLRRTDTLSGITHRVEEAQIDNGTVYRLQAVVGDRSAANRLCDALKADGIECIVK